MAEEIEKAEEAVDAPAVGATPDVAEVSTEDVAVEEVQAD